MSSHTARFGLTVVTFSLLLGSTPQQGRAQGAEFRAFWADVFHVGFKSPAEVDAMISRAVAGGYNVVIPEVMAYQDNAVGSHGAYWRSNIIARSSYVTDTFDPLAYIIQQAHANGIQVHPWLVAFRACTAWPPVGNAILAAHPEYLMVPQASMGSVAPVGSDYQLDPGSPDVQEYLLSIVRELCTNYEIDGIHWDYIRYTQADAGYPADTSYANSSLARFKRITGYAGTPPPTGNTSWDDFRRRSITEIIRRVRAEIPAITSNPRQPLRHSASLITWGNAPSTFSGSSAWARFQNWEEWMRLGFLDTGVPMTYYDYSVYPSYYTNWVNKEMAWRYQRQMVVGPGIYLNTFTDSLTELNYARNAGADGVSTYSYWATKKSSSNDWTWYDYVKTNFFTTPAAVPTMPWRDAATATEGTLWGRVTNPSTGLPIDDATVQVGTLNPVKTDGNGYYVVTMIPAGSGGTSYSVTASATGYGPVTHANVVITAGQVQRDDFSSAGPPPPTITEQPQPQSTCAGGTAAFAVAATGEGTLTYQWQKNSVNLADGGHYSGVTTTTLTVSNADATDAADYRCVVTGDGGSTNSNAAALTLKAATTITQNPAAASVCPGGSTTFTVAATGDGTLSYQWQKNGADLIDGGHYAGATTATLTVSSADANDVAAYGCVVTAGCGTATSSAAGLSLKSAPSITQQPLSQAVDSGATAQFTVAAGGDGPLSYRWQKNGANLSDGGHYSGTTTATLTISPADSSDAASYACVVTGACGSVTSDTATLTINAAPPVITQQPQSTAACASGTTMFTVAATGEGTLTYQWQKNAANLVDGGHYSGATTATLTVSAVDAGDVANYRCVVSNAVGGTTSNDAALTLKAATMVTQDPLSQTVDTGATAQFIVAATGDGALAYQWQKNGANLADGGHYSGVTTTTLTISNTDAGDAAAYRCVVTAGCGSASSAEATLTVNPAPGALAVTPAGSLSSSGDVGGPFTPSSISYTLSNNGGQPIDWTAANTQPWVTLSKTVGTLAAGATDTVIVSINATANGLAAGSYSDTVTFANTTNGNGDTTRVVSLTVNASAGAMSVTPTTGLVSSGKRGGPFTPSSITYTLSNTGGSAINFTVAATQRWVTLSATSGTLAPGTAATVEVSINFKAEKLKPGTYTDTVTFTNTTNGNGNATRPVSLTVTR